MKIKLLFFCERCGALILPNHDRKHAQWHADQEGIKQALRVLYERLEQNLELTSQVVTDFGEVRLETGK